MSVPWKVTADSNRPLLLSAKTSSTAQIKTTFERVACSEERSIFILIFVCKCSMCLSVASLNDVFSPKMCVWFCIVTTDDVFFYVFMCASSLSFCFARRFESYPLLSLLLLSKIRGLFILLCVLILFHIFCFVLLAGGRERVEFLFCKKRLESYPLLLLLSKLRVPFILLRVLI